MIVFLFPIRSPNKTPWRECCTRRFGLYGTCPMRSRREARWRTDRFMHLPHMFETSILFTWLFNNTRGSIRTSGTARKFVRVTRTQKREIWNGHVQSEA
jgi:hypothetical protein